MNKFKQRIPNSVEGVKPKYVQFEMVSDLVRGLNEMFPSMDIKEEDLRYDKGAILYVDEEERSWRGLGTVTDAVDLPNWRGPYHYGRQVETLRGYGLDTYDPVFIGEKFEFRGDEVKMMTWGFAELKDGREVKLYDK